MSEMKTRDSIQLSYGRYLDWKTQNPVLAPGEIACVFDDGSLQPVAIRFGNGLKAFNDLPSIPLVDTGDKYLSEEAPLVYTQEEVDEFRAALSEYIKSVEDTLKNVQEGDASLLEELDEDRSSDNKLLALSSVLKEIELAISTRFGRLLSSSKDEPRVPFSASEDLSSELLYYEGYSVRPRKGDTAYVEGDKREWIYDGDVWEPRITTIPADQQAALQSGITSELVEQLKPIPGKITPLEEKADEAASNASSALEQVNTIKTEMAHLIQECYLNKITITPGREGKGYVDGMPVEISDPLSNGNQPIRGFILSTDGGAIKPNSRTEDPETAVKPDECVFFEFTKQQVTQHEYPIKPVGEYADLVKEEAYGTISSVKVTQDLWESQDYLKKLLDLHYDNVIHRGSVDGRMKGVRDGKLTTLYSSDAVVYVDGDRTEQGTGIEIDPYNDVGVALANIKPGFSGTTIILNAIKDSSGYTGINETLTSDVSFVGYAVGENTTTAVSNFILKKGEVDKISVGFRDLRITSGMTLRGLDDVFMDNVTFDVNTTITLGHGGQLHLSHCTIKGPFTISGSDAKIYLDCCSFSSASSLSTDGTVTVVVEGCTHVHPRIGTGGSYIQFSGSMLSKGNNAPAGYFSGAKLVALYSGVALKRKEGASDQFELATIDVSSVESLSLGTFLFDRVATDAYHYINEDDIDHYRLAGLDAKQVVVSGLDEETAGYDTKGRNTLAAHLDAISRKLFALTGGAGAPVPDEPGSAVTSVKLRPGTVPGTVTLEYYVSTGYFNRSENIAVYGLKSAAYKEEDYFATASGLEEANKQIAATDKTVKGHTTELAGLTSRLGQAEETLRPLPQKVDDVTSTANTAKQKAEANETAIDEVDTRVVSLEEKLRDPVAKEADLNTLKGRVETLEQAPEKELVSNKSKTVGDDTSDHAKYPTVGAVLSELNARESKYEKLASKVTELGDNSSDHDKYPTVGAVIKGLETRIPVSRLPEDDASKIVTEQSFRTLANQRTLIPNQTASSNEDDIFGSIEIVKDKNTVYYDITSGALDNRVSSAQLLKGDTVSYFAYSLGDGSEVKYAHNGLANDHTDVIPSPAEGDYYLNIQKYKTELAEPSLDPLSEVKNITEVLYKYHSLTWRAQDISGKEISTIAKSQGRAQWTGNAWAIISSPAQAFSREQMTAINSGITAAVVDKLKGTGAGDSVADLKNSVYKEITSKLDKACVPTDSSGTSLLTAPRTASGVTPYAMGTLGIADGDLAIEKDTSTDSKVPTVRTVRSIAQDAADKTATSKVESLRQSVADGYQPKVSSAHAGRVLVGTSVAGTLESRVISTSGEDISSASGVNDEGKRLPSNNAVKTYVETVKQALAQEDSALSERITTLDSEKTAHGKRLDTLEAADARSVKKNELWVGGIQPGADIARLAGMIVEFDEEGHLVNSGKSSSAITGTAYVSYSSSTAVADGVTYLIDPYQAKPEQSITSPTIFRLSTAGRTYISNISFKPYDRERVTEDSLPDEWKFGAYIALIQTTASDITRQGDLKQITVANSTLPLSLETIDNGVFDTNMIHFKGSTVYLYSPSHATERFRYTFSPDHDQTVYRFTDSTVSIHLDDNGITFGTDANAPEFTRCTVHLYGKMKFPANTKFTDCIVNVHGVKDGDIDFTLVNNSLVRGTVFINTLSKGVVLADGFEATTFYRSSSGQGSLATNISSTEVDRLESSVLQDFRAHVGKQIEVSYENESDQPKITIKEVDKPISSISPWEAGHFPGHGDTGVSFVVDNVRNATNAKNLQGGILYLSKTKLEGGDTFMSAALTSTGIAKLLDLSTTSIGSLTLGDYLTGTTGVQNAKSAAHAAEADNATEANHAKNATTADSCTGNSATASKWLEAKSFTIVSGDSRGTSKSVDGSTGVDLPLPSVITAEEFRGPLTGNASTSSQWSGAIDVTVIDSDNHRGAAASLDGSKAIELKLPTTITASLKGNVTGNADTATVAEGVRDGRDRGTMTFENWDITEGDWN